MKYSAVLRIYKDKEKLSQMLAADFAGYLAAMTGTEETVYIALSGGSTPTLFFREFVKLKPAVDWSKVRFFWVDERCVPPDHPESNFGVARRELLEPLNIPESSYFRMKGEEEPEREASRYSELIMDTVSPDMTFPVFDRIFLGMGPDGHTASVFPHQVELWNEEKLCTVGTHPETGQQRITFTGHLINAARRVTFLVAGREKNPVVEKIIKAEGDYEKYPAALVQPHKGEVEWYLDNEAAGKLR